MKAWNASFLRHRTVVAELGGQIVGFGDMDKTGYLDRLYVHRDFQGRHIATAICDELERQSGVHRFETYASITARPFFESRGVRGDTGTGSKAEWSHSEKLCYVQKKKVKEKKYEIVNQTKGIFMDGYL